MNDSSHYELDFKDAKISISVLKLLDRLNIIKASASMGILCVKIWIEKV